jgi:hypothetical protein
MEAPAACGAAAVRRFRECGRRSAVVCELTKKLHMPSIADLVWGVIGK